MNDVVPRMPGRKTLVAMRDGEVVAEVELREGRFGVTVTADAITIPAGVTLSIRVERDAPEVIE